ncbi:MAG: tRNA preQ1(34) S-adenosylmethionine ribosyltransferase-isomerase QueA [Deltaproteobacteria bacterium]|nr:tRNA preQ1(34) S-adenosylmethionine ribosyltransferase-isomerase QueA [Deltaproteobacteria bacterium]
MYALSDYDYTLPAELIAQAPLARRDHSRLMVLDADGRTIRHHRFSDLDSLLHAGDVLVINDTRVVPAKLSGTKDTGGRLEALILDYPGEITPQGIVCECLANVSKPLRKGATVFFGPEKTRATVLERTAVGYRLVLHVTHTLDALLERIGEVPLPPYIKRNGRRAIGCDDRRSYQTVYAKRHGAVAAPTAGLHFTAELVDMLKAKGVEIVSVTLHVGYGTFSPVRVGDIRKHSIHAEPYELTKHAAATVNAAKAQGRRVIAVGTTSVRVLEHASHASGVLRHGSGLCDLFIYPGYRFKIIDGLITNFHLPRSTLLMLVSAFAGRDFILKAYKEAVSKRYRFYSYGDAMCIFAKKSPRQHASS